LDLWTAGGLKKGLLEIIFKLFLIKADKDKIKNAVAIKRYALASA